MRVVLFFFVCVAAAGCAGPDVGFFRYSDEVLPPLSPEVQVEIFSGEVDRPHREVGELLVMGGGLGAMEALRAAFLERARAVGAQAVKRVQVVPVAEANEVVWHGEGFRGPWFRRGGEPVVTGGRYATMVRGVALVWVEK